MFEIADSIGMRFSILNAVCTGTTYDQAWIVRVPRIPVVMCMCSSIRARVDALGWLASTCSLRRRNTQQGCLGLDFTKNGVSIRLAGLEAPE